MRLQLPAAIAERFNHARATVLRMLAAQNELPSLLRSKGHERVVHLKSSRYPKIDEQQPRPIASRVTQKHEL